MYENKVNQGEGFVDFGAGLTGVVRSSVAWGDYDNDGDPDILLTGANGSTPLSKIYENRVRQGGGFVEDRVRPSKRLQQLGCVGRLRQRR